VYLASRSGLPLVPLCASYCRFWTLPSWDGFQVPWPFTRALVHAGTPIELPPDLDAAGVEAWRARLQAVLARVTAETDECASARGQAGRPPQASP
jgi:lysophospholipid acyltransferase (LPLAT)-like uncharacterized protein